MNPTDLYISHAAGCAYLILNDQIAQARVILASFLAVGAQIEAAIAQFSPNDPRLDEFRKMGPSALKLLDGQLEDTAAVQIEAAQTFLIEMSNS